MGSNSSKTNDTPDVLKGEAELANPDPRSPTPEIARTPLQGKNGAKHNITKNMDLRKTFESTNGDEKMIHNNPILSAVIKNHLQSYDPRSPSQDFERTPIVITSKLNDITDGTEKIKLQNDGCDSPLTSKHKDSLDTQEICEEALEFSPDLIAPKNLCNGFFDATLNDSFQDTEEPLGSSTASKETLESTTEIKPTKLLETNFDFIEDGQEINDEDNESYSDSKEINEKEVGCVPVFKILQYDPRSPSIGIDRTPLVVPKLNEDDSIENVEEMSDDSLIKVLQNTNGELHNDLTPPKNSDELLVYEDDSTNINCTPIKSKYNSDGSRTPLSCMKNKADTGHVRSKSANTVFDPKDKETNLKLKKVSHIPRLKSLSKHSKNLPTGSSISLKNISKAAIIGGDCENTPPHSHRDRWDKDSSIVL